MSQGPAILRSPRIGPKADAHTEGETPAHSHQYEGVDPVIA